MSGGKPCTTDFCVCVPQDNDLANCDEEFMTRDLSCGVGVVCHSEWVPNITPAIVCYQGSIQRFDIIKNPKELGFTDEEFIWSCNSVVECNQKIPKCERFDFSPSPTSAPGGVGDNGSSPAMAPSSSSDFATRTMISPEFQVLFVFLSFFVMH